MPEAWGGTTVRTAFFAALVFVAATVPMGSTVGQTPNLEQKIWTLLDNDKAPFVALSEPDFRALGAGFDLPDGGRAVTELAEKAPGGAFDPRDLSKISPQQLGYRAEWVVERFRRYDEDLLQKQALVYDDETKLMQSTRDALVDLQRLFEADAERAAERQREKGPATPGDTD